MKISKTAITFLLLLHLITLRAEIRLPSILSDGMVLQQNSVVTLWGWGEASEKIQLIPGWLPNDTINTVVDNMGKWAVEVKTIAAGGPYSLLIKGSSVIELKDIMMGEVWLCSGQSNMEWSVNHGIQNGEQEASEATYPFLRIFHIPKQGASTPQDDCRSLWKSSSPNSMRVTSSLGYFFGRHLSESLQGVPVGIIVAAWGGTPAEVWAPKEIASRYIAENTYSYSSEPWWPVKPGVLYNGMIHPVTSYRLSGCIWYQGESNHENTANYANLITDMVSHWRNSFGSEFPFYLVQIAPYEYNSKNNTPALLREQQELLTYRLHNCHMITISDLVDNVKDIHPRDKRNVGIRLANLALRETYQRNVSSSKSPVLDTHTVRKDKIMLTFKLLEGGLVCKGKKIEGLKIAAKNGVYLDASAKIKGDKLIVWSPYIKDPYSVRYCFDDATIGNLFSEQGIPVAPFRTNRNDEK